VAVTWYVPFWELATTQSVATVVVALFPEPLRLLGLHVGAGFGAEVKAHCTLPVGVPPPDGPVTIALKVRVWPGVGLEGDTFTLTVGMGDATVTVA
jgi:hypothetical protein